MQLHRLDRTTWQHQADSFALGWADRPEDVSRGGAQIPWRRKARVAPGSAPRDLVLLADPRLIGKPDPLWLAIGLVDRDFRQTRGEVFLEAATAASLLA